MIRASRLQRTPSWRQRAATLLLLAIGLGLLAYPLNPNAQLASVWQLLVAALLGYQLKALFDVYGHLLLAKTGIQTRAPHDAYIRALFDGYADHYDRHLLVDLDYQGANLISRAVGQRLAAFAQPRVADLGCGTGLCGVLLRDRAAALVGIDLSAEMLQQAHARNLYDALHQCHIEVFLRTRPRRFELLVAADVLVYIGDLRPLLRAAADSLVPGGYFAFTTETCSSKRGYRLTRSGRYAHDPEQLRQLACQCGLQPVLLQSQPLRRQGHSSVQGNLVLLQRAADNRLT